MRTEQEVRDALGIMGITVRECASAVAEGIARDPHCPIDETDVIVAEAVRMALAWVLRQPDGEGFGKNMIDASLDDYRKETAHERN
jgi:hypothetical protein